MRRSIIFALAVLMLSGMARAGGAERPPILLELDATQAPTGVLHAHLSIPAAAGILDLAYPKWIPGEHSPAGPISQIVKLVFSGGGKPLAWHRDALDIYVFHVEVPEGVTQVQADLDFACLVGQEGFQSDICTSYDQLVVNWWLVVLYPPSLPNDQDPFQASIRLPQGWHYNSALPFDRAQADNLISFKTVSLKTLVDSPLIAATHLRTVPLGGKSPAVLAISAEKESELNIAPAEISHFKRMVAEAEAIFDGPRYAHYNLLVSLGDAIDHYTLEHFESSENRLPEHGLSDSRVLLTTATMIPHEYLHSWNGKYRTPSGLDISTYQDPMKAELIWVYEGLTDYIANIITARSGFWSEDQLAQSLAIDAAQMTYHTGRTWRSLQDTTVGVQMMLTSPNAWVSARRNADFYAESGLMWLEADGIIRQISQGHHSLDDFCKGFFGPQSSAKPYTFDDVVSAMNEVAPYDWKTFLRNHLDSTTADPPLAGLARSGWKLIYTDQKSELITDMEQVHKVDLLWPEWQKSGFVDLRYSIGLLIQDDGTVLDSAPGMSGYNAGVVPGMQLVSVNGVKFSLSTLEDAVRNSKLNGQLELQVANGNFTDRHSLDYHGGLRYPHLQRDPSKPDLLREIVAPRAPPTLAN